MPLFKVWDLFYDADSVRSMLTRKIQEESLRTYLFTYSNVYDSISIVSIREIHGRSSTCMYCTYFIGFGLLFCTEVMLSHHPWWIDLGGKVLEPTKAAAILIFYQLCVQQSTFHL